jgi:RHS repeat-associated protein
MTGAAYDGAGNLLSDGVNSYAYDAENRMISVTSGGATTTYTYDAAGRRIKSSGPLGTFEYVYDAAGRAVGQWDVTAAAWTRIEVYANGEHLASYVGGAGGTTYFAHADWLGTERVRSDVSGNQSESFTNLPFGDALSGVGASPVHFTGQERDAESNLDHFWFRQYSSTLARWMTPDPAGMAAVDLSNPQSLNRYAYVMNNPVNTVDPLGLNPPFGEPLETGGWFGVIAPEFSGPGYYVDGVQVSASAFDSLVSSGAALIVPAGWQPVTRGPNRGCLTNAPENGQIVCSVAWYRWTNPVADSTLTLVPGGGPAANNGPKISAPPPSPPTTPRQSFAACMTGELINNFLGDKNRAGITVAVHVAAIVVRQGAGSLLPGPGWLYTGTAIVWDVAMVGKSYVTCRQELQ